MHFAGAGVVAYFDGDIHDREEGACTYRGRHVLW
jgi:hypothetical protein